MIYYNLNTINDWNFGDDNIIKVYKHGAVVFYKFDGEQGGYKVCFAVVNDISQYQETEFEDVYDKATEKWFKLNNLNQYEEYGVYGSGRSVTTYNGKLTIDDGYEYQYSGGSWVNVGEVSGTSITIKSPEYIEKTSSFRSGYIDLDYVLKDNSMFQLKVKPTNNGGSIVFGQQNSTADNNDYRIFWASSRLYYDYGSDRKYTSQALNNTYEYEVGNYYVKNLATSATVLTGTTKSGTATSMTRKIGMWPTSTSSSDYAQIFYVKIYEGNTLIRDLIPWTDMNGNYGMFDKLSLTTYRSTNALTASTVINDVEVGGGIEYPLEYVVREDPPDNLVFSSMEEAEAYECPWVGMRATIDGDRYIFSGDSISGYEWVYQPILFYSLQDLINTYPTQGTQPNYSFTDYSNVSGITYFRFHPSKGTSESSYVYADHNADNATGTTKFVIKSDANGSLYSRVDGYSTLKDAANASSCTWAYWIDADTIEIDVVTAVGTTIYIKQWQTNFVTDIIEYKFE